MKNVKDVLVEARALISNPVNWTKRVSARNRDGEEINPCHEEAFCFCITGALERAVGSRRTSRNLDGAVLFDRAYNTLRVIGKVGSTLPSFNDAEHTEHHHVLDLFDRTLAGLTDEDY